MVIIHKQEGAIIMTTETYNYQPQQAEVVSFKQWMKFFLLSLIPFVGIVLLFMWAFGDNVNPNKKNYAKASLVFTAIFVVLYILFMVLFFAVFASAMSSF